MNRIYAIGDIHGHFALLQLLMQKIEARRAPDEGQTIVFLGDYVDRGPRSREVVEFLMRGPSNPKDTWICLKGNHEDLMVTALNDANMTNVRNWYGNGGDATIINWENPPGTYQRPPDEVISWIENLPFIHETENHIFVHAGLMPGIETKDQDEQTCLWIRYRFLDHGPEGWTKHIVHGHTPDGPDPELKTWRTNLDTWVWSTGILTAGVFDLDIKGGPVEIIQAERWELT